MTGRPRHPKARPGPGRALVAAFVLVGAIALVASVAPAAWAGPAEEEYELQLPDARGGGSSPSPDEARALLRGGGSLSTSRGDSSRGGASGRTYGGTDSGSGGSQSGEAGTAIDNQDLLAKGRGSDLPSAATAAVSKAPLGLAVAAILLLIAVGGVLVAQRMGRIDIDT